MKILFGCQIGPPNTLFLPKSDPKEWSSLNVARSVIADKTANVRIFGELELFCTAICFNFRCFAPEIDTRAKAEGSWNWRYREAGGMISFISFSYHMNSILIICSSQIDGETYWKFEYLNQKSPTIQVLSYTKRNTLSLPTLSSLTWNWAPRMDLEMCTAIPSAWVPQKKVISTPSVLPPWSHHFLR